MVVSDFTPGGQAMCYPGYEDEIMYIEEEEAPRRVVRRRVPEDVEIVTIAPDPRRPSRQPPPPPAAREPKHSDWWKNKSGHPYRSNKMRLEFDVSLNRKRRAQPPAEGVRVVDVEERRYRSHGSIPVPPPAPEPPGHRTTYHRYTSHEQVHSQPPQDVGLPDTRQSRSPPPAYVVEVAPPEQQRRAHRSAASDDDDYIETEVEVAPSGRRRAEMERDRRDTERTRVAVPRSVVVHQDRAPARRDEGHRRVRRYYYPQDEPDEWEVRSQRIVRVDDDEERRPRRRRERRVHFDDDDD